MKKRWFILCLALFFTDVYACMPMVKYGLESCDDPRGVRIGLPTTELDCRACENRKIQDGYCVLKECPEDKPVRGAGMSGLYPWSCLSCSDENVWLQVERDECLTCGRIFDEDRGACLPYRYCEENEMLFSAFDDVCWERSYYCLNVLESLESFSVTSRFLSSTFKGKNGSWFMCNSNLIVASSEKQCAKCSNREFVNGYCVLKTNAPMTDVGWMNEMCVKGKNRSESGDVWDFVDCSTL